MSAPVVIEAAGREVIITNPDKVFFSKRGETKLDLVRYYLSVQDPLMSTMADRPTLMHRFPDGVGAKNFFQKRVPKSAPAWLQTTLVSTPNGTTSNALVAADIAHLLWAVNLGCLGFHPWPYRASAPAFADELRIDLDPQPGTNFDLARDAALEAKKLLDELGIVSYPKTTGSKGIHIWIRLQARWTSYEVRAACVALARELERRRPDIVTAAWWKEQRGARILVDYNQNAPHKTVFGPWSVRPRVGAQVACPLPWSDIATVKPEELTMATVPTLLTERGDPWATLNKTPQDIGPLLEMSASDMAAGLMDAPWPPQYPRQPNEPPRVAPSRARKPDG